MEEQLARHQREANAIMQDTEVLRIAKEAGLGNLTLPKIVEFMQ